MLKLSSFRSVASVAVLCAFTSSGTAQTVQWMRQGGWGGQGQGIAYDAAENCYVVGMVGDPALFDQDTMASHFADAFIAKYDPAGVLQWVRTGGGELAEQASDIVVDAAGNAYVTGYIATNGVLPTVAFDGTVISGLGATDLFVAGRSERHSAMVPLRRWRPGRARPRHRFYAGWRPRGERFLPGHRGVRRGHPGKRRARRYRPAEV
ncbi:MAG: hypothetical protein IPL77_12405 [Flavobacteriales bacterium]|nr:hypothetical protein [Flavobacteriales bacterium]